MPLYEYKCDNCGDVFELIQRFSDSPLTVHEKCGGPVHRLLSAPALHFKGSGWYITDYAKSGSGASGSSDKSEKSEKSEKAGKNGGSKSDSDSKSSSESKTSDSKSSSESKSDSSKPAPSSGSTSSS